jgi:hypothetical protein
VTTGTQRRTDDAVPEAWPPLTPVEVLRFSRALTCVCLLGTLAVVGAVAVAAWISHRDCVAIITLLSKETR